MKRLFFLLALTGFLTHPLQADEVLQNGDFTDGSTHWHGAGKSPADYAQDNPLATSDPLMSKGLLVQLKPHAWTTVYQDFKGDKGTHYFLKVTYKLSSDVAFSNQADDYTNLPDKIRSETWTPSDLPVGQFFVSCLDRDDQLGFWEKVSPKLGSTDTQTFPDAGLPMSPLGSKVVTVSFPPGTGTVVILSISVNSSP